MRRDRFSVTTSSDGDRLPTLTIRYEGSEELDLPGVGSRVTAGDIDAAFRLQETDDDATGVFGLTHRMTGEYVLEVNVEAKRILSLVGAARDGEKSVLVRIHLEEREPFELELDTLLVYDGDGDLLREHSLIPNGVEL